MRAIVLAVLLAQPAAAATLRPFTSLSQPMVHLSDLFDDAGSDRVLGPAPQPGGRISVEAPQLAAIARQFGVDWRPNGSADRVVIERPGHALPREAAIAALRTALTAAGVSPDSEIDVPAFAPPIVPPGDGVTSDVGQLDYDPATGRFTALLTIMSDGMEPSHVRLLGRVQEMAEIPVATHKLLAGAAIEPGDVEIGRLRTDSLRASVVRTMEQAVGMALRHPVFPGQPLPLADLGRPIMVAKGAAVAMLLDGPGISLTAQGISTDSGALGERVHVLNPVSRAMVEADVIGPNRARVTPGTPVRPAFH
jgi:flagella basal body P-ring formation protein FlgA